MSMEGSREEDLDIPDSNTRIPSDPVVEEHDETKDRVEALPKEETPEQDFTTTEQFDLSENATSQRNREVDQQASTNRQQHDEGKSDENVNGRSLRERLEDEDAEDDDDDDDDDDETNLLSDSSCDTETNGELVQLLPKVNCPEKIILCLDLSAEMKNTPFLSKDGTRYPSLQMVKRAVSIFVHSKAAINRKHEFALVVLQDNALWMHNFTNNTEEFCYVLADLDNENDYDSFDMSSLFEVISDKVTLPSVDGEEDVIPPPYIVRTIIIYGRSHCVPEFSQGRQVMQSLMQSPYFFLDAFYLHESPNDDNHCEVIFDKLCDLDERGTSFVFEVSRNPTYLHDNMAKLVAHPLQRPLQKDISYKLIHEFS